MRSHRCWIPAAALALLLVTPPLSAQSVWYVDDDATLGNGDGSSWMHAFLHPDDAFVAAQAGDEIRIAQGRYVRSNGLFVPAGVTIRGGYGGLSADWWDVRAPYGQPTILDGDLNGDDLPDGGNREDNIATVLQLGADAVLDGLVVRGGRLWGVSGAPGLELIDCVVTDNGRPTTVLNGDAGLYVPVGTTTTLRRSRFVDNWGVGANISGERTTVVDCLFAGNEDRGAFLSFGEIEVVRSTFTGNRGGGAFLGGSFGSLSTSLVSVTESLFADNRWDAPADVAAGGGAGVVADRAQVLRSRFARNTVSAFDEAQGGGLFTHSDDLSVRECEFVDNVAGPSATGDACGGALAVSIDLDTTDVDVRNCTLVGNHADDEAGGLFVTGPWHTAFLIVRPRSLILWNNTDGTGDVQTAQLSADGTVSLLPQHSCIEGYVPALPPETNIASDPLLTAPEGPDGVLGTPDDGLRLSAGSPCIDAGYSIGTGLGAKDLALRVRRVDDPDTPDTGESIGSSPVIDMGAYEFGAPLVVGQWFDRGAALAGSLGEPRLEGKGTLLPGTHYRLIASAVPPLAAGILVLGLDELSAPFKGGTMVPQVDFWISMPVTPSGEFEVSAPWPAFPVSDQTFWWQLWIVDPAGPFGFAASNGLTCTAP